MVFVTRHARPSDPRIALHWGCHAAEEYQYATSVRRSARPASLGLPVLARGVSMHAWGLS